MGNRDKTAFRRGQRYKRTGKPGKKHKPTKGAFGNGRNRERNLEAEKLTKAVPRVAPRGMRRFLRQSGVVGSEEISERG